MKAEPINEDLATMPLAYQPGCEPVTPNECDYCAADAAHWHFADRVVNRNAYACDEHVVYLSRWHRNSVACK